MGANKIIACLNSWFIARVNKKSNSPVQSPMRTKSESDFGYYRYLAINAMSDDKSFKEFENEAFDLWILFVFHCVESGMAQEDAMKTANHRIGENVINQLMIAESGYLDVIAYGLEQYRVVNAGAELTGCATSPGVQGGEG